MDELKKSIRKNLQGLNYQNVYSILLDQYFSLLEQKPELISIPFMNLIYRTQPKIIHNIIRNNVPSVYILVLRLKSNFLKDIIVQYPEVLVQSIQIYFDRIDAKDAFKLEIGIPLLDGLIDDSSLDSYFLSEGTIHDFSIPPSMNPISSITNFEADLFHKYLTSPYKLDLIELDSPTSITVLKKYLIQPSRPGYIRYNELRPFVLQGMPAQGPIRDAALQFGRVRQNLNTSVFAALRAIKISKKLLHNVQLIIYRSGVSPRLGGVIDDHLYSAFRLYPLTKTLNSNDDTGLILEAVADVTLFRDSTNAIAYYREILYSGQVVNTVIPVRQDRSEDLHVKYSLLEEVPDGPTPYNVKSYNTAQLVKRISEMPSENYINPAMNPIMAIDPRMIDVPLLCHFMTNKSIVPSNLTWTSLEELLDYYLPLIPTVNVTAIILLLLYNSSNYMSWVETYKKHKTIMQSVITRSVILSEQDKQRLRQSLI